MRDSHPPTTPAAPARVRTVVAYLRSGTANGEGLRRLQRQRSAIQAEADFQGWTVVAWTTDPGQRGDTLDRPGLRQALALLAGGKADALVASEEGRIASAGSDRRQLARLAGRQGWQVLTVEALRTPSPDR